MECITFQSPVKNELPLPVRHTFNLDYITLTSVCASFFSFVGRGFWEGVLERASGGFGLGEGAFRGGVRRVGGDPQKKSFRFSWLHARR